MQAQEREIQSCAPDRKPSKSKFTWVESVKVEEGKKRLFDFVLVESVEEGEMLDSLVLPSGNKNKERNERVDYPPHNEIGGPKPALKKLILPTRGDIVKCLDITMKNNIPATFRSSSNKQNPPLSITAESQSTCENPKMEKSMEVGAHTLDNSMRLPHKFLSIAPKEPMQNKFPKRLTSRSCEKWEILKLRKTIRNNYWDFFDDRISLVNLFFATEMQKKSPRRCSRKTEPKPIIRRCRSDGEIKSFNFSRKTEA